MEASFCVAADGAWSPVRRLLGGQHAAGSVATDEEHDETESRRNQAGWWLAYRGYVRGVTGDAAERPWVSFSESLLPGYAWSFPIVGGAVNLGVGMVRPARASGQSLRRAWTDTLRDPFMSPAVRQPMRCSKDPSRRGRSRAVVVPSNSSRGEGGCSSPATRPRRPIRSRSTGEGGIGQALSTGAAAGESIVGFAPRPDAVAATYVDAVRGATSAPNSDSPSPRRHCSPVRSSPAARCGRQARAVCSGAGSRVGSTRPIHAARCSAHGRGRKVSGGPRAPTSIARRPTRPPSRRSPDDAEPAECAHRRSAGGALSGRGRSVGGDSLPSRSAAVVIRCGGEVLLSRDWPRNDAPRR